MTQLLQPPSSINDLRTKAHLVLSSRLQALDLTQLLVYTIVGAPASILPYLTWQMDMDVPAAPMVAAGVSLISILQKSLQYHQFLGTPATLLAALTVMGYGGSSIQEGQASWGGTSYPPSQGWAVFRVNLASTGALTPAQIAQVTSVINFFKPARSKLDAIIVAVPAFIDNETPTGAVNGINKTFVLSQTPQPSTGLELYNNGLLMTQGVDYTLLGPIISFIIAPSLGDIIRAFYRYGVVGGGFQEEVPSGAINGTNTTFTLSVAPSPALSLEFYKNGLLMTAGIDYTLSGATITTAAPPQAGDLLNAFYRFGTAPSSPLFSDAEVPSGLLNGVNNTYTLAAAPTPLLSLRLFKNGDMQTQGIDYTLLGNTVTYTVAPATGDKHVAFYRH